MIRPHYVPLYDSVCHSEKLADLKTHAARVFYLLLLTRCDSWGRHTARPRVLHAQVWAMFGPASEVPGILADLARVGLVRLYSSGGEQYLAIPDWEDKAGKVGRPDRRGPSTCPEPPDYSGDRGTTPAEPVTPPDQSRLARAGESEKRREEKRREEPREERAGGAADVGHSPLPIPLDTPGFAHAWSEWVAYRRERGAKLTPRTVRAQLRALAAVGEARARATLEMSIRNGWQGLFPERASGGLPGPFHGKAPLDQRIAALDAAFGVGGAT